MDSISETTVIFGRSEDVCTGSGFSLCSTTEYMNSSCECIPKETFTVTASLSLTTCDITTAETLLNNNLPTDILSITVNSLTCSSKKRRKKRSITAEAALTVETKTSLVSSENGSNNFSETVENLVIVLESIPEISSVPSSSVVSDLCESSSGNVCHEDASCHAISYPGQAMFAVCVCKPRFVTANIFEPGLHCLHPCSNGLLTFDKTNACTGDCV